MFRREGCNKQRANCGPLLLWKSPGNVPLLLAIYKIDRVCFFQVAPGGLLPLREIFIKDDAIYTEYGNLDGVLSVFAAKSAMANNGIPIPLEISELPPDGIPAITIKVP